MTDYLRHESSRTYYSLTEREFEIYETSASPVWKDLCLVSVSLALPTMLNALSEMTAQQSFRLTLNLFLNSLFGIISLFLGLGFGVVWWRIGRKKRKIIEEIKNKPRMVLTLSSHETRLVDGLMPIANVETESEDVSMAPVRLSQSALQET